jgi:hypothetical protein
MATPPESRTDRPVAVSTLFATKFGHTTFHHPSVRARATTARLDVEALGCVRCAAEARFSLFLAFFEYFSIQKTRREERFGAHDAVFARPRRRGVPLGGVGA